MRSRSISQAVLFLIITFFTLSFSAAESWGAKAAALDTDRSIAEMLRYAVEDEYLARAEYYAIMKAFGDMRPFSNIVASEESHIQWLADNYASRSMSMPPDLAPSLVHAPESLKAAYEAGVQAEIDNIAMYESFLGSPLLAKPENKDLKDLFIRLRDASKNHLKAFQNGLAKY